MQFQMEEENESFREMKNYKFAICTCLQSDSELTKTVSEEIEISEHKEFILSTVARTENYLRERRIPELIRFLLTQVISLSPDHPVEFLEKMLDDCMLFRAGLGKAPVLYENRHLEAVIRSFDPGQRGWLSVGQVRRLYTTLGFSLQEFCDERLCCEEILKNLKKCQEIELFQLLVAGMSRYENKGGIFESKEYVNNESDEH